jgi:hypothetical protein
MDRSYVGYLNMINALNTAVKSINTPVNVPRAWYPEKHNSPTRRKNMKRPVARYMKPRLCAMARAVHPQWTSKMAIKNANANK